MTIDLKQKKDLVALVKTGITIKEAASQLGLNYSTAKHIVKYYKQHGFDKITSNNNTPKYPYFNNFKTDLLEGDRKIANMEVFNNILC